MLVYLIIYDIPSVLVLGRTQLRARAVLATLAVARGTRQSDSRVS